MIHAVIFTLSLSGFAVLLLAMARHQQDWLRRKLAVKPRRRLRIAGFALIALAFVAAGKGFGLAYGSVLWCGWLTVAAVLVVTANTNRERIQRRFAKAGR